MAPIPPVDVIIVGGGFAGLSAAIYLGRARRSVLLIDGGKSMAQWEPEVANYLGFPQGISGGKLLRRARQQALKYPIQMLHDLVTRAHAVDGLFEVGGNTGVYRGRYLLLATGAFHIPPDLPGIKRCLGHSLFFCKDCDGWRVFGKTTGVYGWTKEAAEYALGIKLYSEDVFLATDGRRPRWSRRHADWLRQHGVRIYREPIREALHSRGQLHALRLADGEEIPLEALFCTRGDLYLNQLAKELGAKLSREGSVRVNGDMRTSIKRLYAAGCLTPANCQMIIAAGQGATAAQAINRDLFEHQLAEGTLEAGGAAPSTPPPLQLDGACEG